MQPPRQIAIDPAQTSGIECVKCRHPFFTESFLLRKISKIIIGGPTDVTMPIPVFRCQSCGTVCADALAPEIKQLFEAPAETAVEPETGGAKIIQMETK